MAQSYYWSGDNSSEYKQALTTGDKIQKYSDRGMVWNAIYNPRTSDIHVTTDNPERITSEMWANWPKVMNSEKYRELKALSASGKVNADQAAYNFVYPEFQDQMVRYADKYKAHGAAVITSTEFPQITVSTFSQALINRQQLVAQKYNLLDVPQKITVSDTINVIFPEYNNTNPSSVRVGYKENESIDTAGYGAITQTNVSLKKAGAGLAFTEEYYMRQFTMDIQSLLLEKISLDFLAARYNRIITKLGTLPTLASTQTAGGWALLAATGFSNNRPGYDITAVRKAIFTSDKLSAPDTIITNEKQWMDFYSNSFIRGAYVGDLGSTTTANFNQIINNPPGLPWAKQWIINEDTADNVAYILDSRFLVSVEGPRKTQQINTYNPDQTIFIEKQWFDVIVPSTRTNWGRKLTSI